MNNSCDVENNLLFWGTALLYAMAMTLFEEIIAFPRLMELARKRINYFFIIYIL